MYDAEGEDWKVSFLSGEINDSLDKMIYNRTTVATPSGSSAGSDCGSDA